MAGPMTRIAAWLRRWNPILPLLLAEFVLWTGFGALLPVMPLYFREHGVPLAALGAVIAAWPAARLVAEPVFGLIADRSRRVPLLVGGLVVAAIGVAGMLAWTGFVAFVALRALAGFGTAMYDPAARGYLIDATPEDRMGEAFGLYSSAQMGGILMDPAIGGLGAAMFGGFAFVVLLGAVLAIAAAALVAARVRERPHGLGRAPLPASSVAEFPSEAPNLTGQAATDASAETPRGTAPALVRPAGTGQAGTGPASLWNRRFGAALVVNLAGYAAGGLYEVIWSVYVLWRGGSLGLIGLTFALFGLTTLLVSPFAGRVVDRLGAPRFVVIGMLGMAIAMAAYSIVSEPLVYPLIIAFEAVCFSFSNPATYSIVVAGSPVGRSATAQGIFGAFGTLGTIGASLAAGALATIDLRAPFFAGVGVVLVLLAVALLVGGRSLWQVRPSSREPTPA